MGDIGQGGNIVLDMVGWGLMILAIAIAGRKKMKRRR